MAFVAVASDTFYVVAAFRSTLAAGVRHKQDVWFNVSIVHIYSPLGIRIQTKPKTETYKSKQSKQLKYTQDTG